MRRDWSLVLEKRRRAAASPCPVCGGGFGCLQAAHTIGRARDRDGVVQPDEIVFLCEPCHREYDAHRLDIWGVLSPQERQAAVLAAGGAGHALRRLSAPLWRSARPSDVRTIDERLRELMQHEHRPSA